MQDRNLKLRQISDDLKISKERAGYFVREKEWKVSDIQPE